MKPSLQRLPLFIALTATLNAASVTYDANTTTTAAQDGAGAGWNTTNTNFWNGTADVAWPNTTSDTAVFGAGTGAGAAGTVTVGTVTTNNITFNAPGSGNYTLAGGTITLGGTTPTITSIPNATISAVLAGTSGLAVTSTGTATGTLTLSGANTYSGTTTITTAANGVTGITVANASALGTSSVQVNGSNQFSSGLVVNAGLTITNALTLKPVSSGSGRALVSLGVGTTWSGNISLDNSAAATGGFPGILALGTLASPSVVSGNITLTTAGSNTIGLALRNSGGFGNITGSVSMGTATVQILDTANWQFSNATNTWGTLDINNAGAKVYVGAANVLSPTGVVTCSGAIGGTLRLSNQAGTSSFDQTIAGLKDAGANVVNVTSAQAATLTLNTTSNFASGGVISGPLALVKSGSATQVLAGANTYTGGTTISGGTLQVGSGGATGALGPGAIVDNGVLAFNRNTTSALTVSTAISGSGSVTQIGTGTTILSGTNSYTGGTTITSGTLSLGSASAVGTGTVLLNGGTLQFTAANTADITTTSGAYVLVDFAISGIDTNGQSVTFANPISTDVSSVGGLNKLGSGTLTLRGNNTYSNNTQITAGTLNLDYTTVDDSKISDFSPLVMAGGTLQLTGGTHQEIVASTAVIAGNSTITRASGAATIALGDITRTGSTATLNITAPNIATTTLSNDVSGKLPTWITVNGQTAAADDQGNIVAYSSFTDVVRLGGLLPNTPTANVRIVDGGTSGPITPATTGSPTDVSSIHQIATAGPAAIAMGADTLRLGATGSLTVPTGAGALTITGGALTAGGADATPGDITVDTIPTTTLNLPVTDNGSSMVTLTQKNTGALVLSGANTYTGVTTISGGILQIGGASNLNAGSYSGAIANAGTFIYSSSATQTLSGVISGTGALTKDTDATSILTLTGVNTYTGDTTISAGTLEIGGAGNLNAGSYSGAIANAGTFIYSSSATQTLSGVISGAGAITTSGASTLTLAGANTYSGTTTINTASAGVVGVIAANASAFGTGSVVVNGSSQFNSAVSVNAGLTIANALTLKPINVGSSRALITLGVGSTWSGNISLDNSTATTAGFPGIVTLGTLASPAVVSGNISLTTAGTNTDALVLRSSSSYGNVTGSISVGTALVELLDSTNWQFSNTSNTWGTLSIDHAAATAYVGAANALSPTGVVTSSAGGTLRLSNIAGTSSFSQTIAGLTDTGTNVVKVSSAQAATLTLTTATPLTTTGVISGPIALVMAGTGTQALAGANTYTGATTVSAGNLAVNNTTGSGTGTGAVTVSAAGTLSGTGTLSGAVTDSGTLAPGRAGVGTLSTGALTLSGSYACDLSGSTADKVAVAGDLNVTGATLAITATGSQSGTLIIASYTGTLTGTFGTVTGLPSGYSVNYNAAAKQIELVGAAGYTTWAATNAGGQAANLDFDHDGVPNGVEYFMGKTGSTFTANPQPVNGVITWPKDPTATATYVVETSPDLVAWTTATSGVTDNGTSVSYTLPTGSQKVFVRIRVTTP